jgi:Sigma-70 region 2
MTCAELIAQDKLALARCLAKSELALAGRLAAKFASKSGTPHLTDEWEGAAGLGLVEAAASYDPARGTAFRTHATRRIWGAIQDEARCQMPKGFRRNWLRKARAEDPDAQPPETRSLDFAYESQGEEPGRGPIKLSDLVVDPSTTDDPVGWEIEWHDEVERMARSLPLTMRSKFRDYHATTGGMRAVGKRLGCSESRVSQCVTQSHHFLSESLSAKEPAMPENLNGHAKPEPPDDPAEIAAHTAVLRKLKEPRRTAAICERIPPDQLDAALPARLPGRTPPLFGTRSCADCGHAFRPPLTMSGAIDETFSTCLACRRKVLAVPEPPRANRDGQDVQDGDGFPSPDPAHPAHPCRAPSVAAAAPVPEPVPAERVAGDGWIVDGSDGLSPPPSTLHASPSTLPDVLCSECRQPFVVPFQRKGLRPITRCGSCRVRHQSGAYVRIQPQVDPELSAMAVVLALEPDAARRVIAYVLIRLDSGGAS